MRRKISYGIIEFHRDPVLLLPITSPFASHPEKVNFKCFHAFKQYIRAIKVKIL